MTPSKSAIAVIIGRAGSKGLPGKNALPIAGKPMIAHTIGHAQSATSVDRIVVSTDGEDIAAAARSCDVAVVDRPAKLADDHATVDSAVRHALDEIADDHETVVILYANIPVRPPNLIDRAVLVLHKTRATSVQSYCPVGKHHPHWMVNLDPDGRVSPYMESKAYRRQDLPDVYTPDGGVIAVRRDALYSIRSGEPHAFLGDDRHGIITTPGSVVDVDTGQDFALAEALLNQVAC